jgi:hypothetical protein
MEDEKKLDDAKIIQSVLDAVGITANKFSVELGLKSPASIYHIIDGRNDLSAGMIEKIITRYPRISYDFLRNGVGEVVVSEENSQNQMNFFNIPTHNPLQEFSDMPKKLDLIANLLTIQNEMIETLIELNTKKADY